MFTGKRMEEAEEQSRQLALQLAEEERVAGAASPRAFGYHV